MLNLRYSAAKLQDVRRGGIIGDVDTSGSIKTPEVGAMRKMLDRTQARFGVTPDWIAADTAQGSAGTLVWLTLKRKFLPFIVTVS